MPKFEEGGQKALYDDLQRSRCGSTFDSVDKNHKPIGNGDSEKSQPVPSAEERARDVFEAFVAGQLVAAATEPDAENEQTAWHECLARHPDLAEELTKLYRGNLVLEDFLASLRPSRVLRKLDEQGGAVNDGALVKDQVVWRKLIAAGLVLCVICLIVYTRFDKSGEFSRRTRLAASHQISKALSERSEMLSSVAKYGTAVLVSELRQELTNARAEPRDRTQTLEEFEQRLLDDLEVNLRRVRGRLSIDKLEQVDLDTDEPSSLVLRDPPVLMVLADALAKVDELELVEFGDSPLLAELSRATRDRTIVRLVVIDVDGDWKLVTGADVFVQQFDFGLDRFDPPIYAGTTPNSLHLTPGEWRITVQDTSDAERPRFSQVRAMVPPMADDREQVMFLRSVPKKPRGMVYFPPCEFIYGSADESFVGTDGEPYTKPASKQELHGFWFAQCEVTIGQYQEFYEDLLRHVDWFPEGIPVLEPFATSWPLDCVRNAISWRDAQLYANWAGMRLPTDREWERVARGDINENRKYPWGNDFAAGQLPAGDVEIKDPNLVAVDTRLPSSAYFLGQEICGLSTHGSEWVEDLFFSFDEHGNPFFGEPSSAFFRVVRGASSWFTGEQRCRTDFRYKILEHRRRISTSIRCARSEFPNFVVPSSE